MEEPGDEYVRILAPPALKKREVATSKKCWKKNVKDVEEDEKYGSKNWKDYDVKTMISLHGEMEPQFLKNAKKQNTIFAYLKFLHA